MRKLKLQVQTSADGYMGGPNGEMDWMTFPWTDDVGAYINNLMASVDTIVLGRNLAEGFIPVWANRTEADGEDQETIDWMNNTPKIVFSNTLTESPGPTPPSPTVTSPKPSPTSRTSPAATSSSTAAPPSPPP
ncbi:dihydrofolate reductase family protein [Nocardia sp. NPDC052316]|uniref:dihydrofolate reductase family protein n=1 Tax=Nocardia sp. NPDC052316 TaxID=3364329 RepID=UPI0037CA6C4F